MKLLARVLVLILSCFILLNTSYGRELSNSKAAKIYANFLELINKNSNSHISNKEVIKTSINSVLQQLNDNSYFIDEKDYHVLSQIREGHFYGIGISLEYSKGACIIKDIIQESPADKAGLSKDDIVLEIEKSKLTESTVYNVLHRSILKNKKDVEIVVKEKKTNIIKKYNIIKKEIRIKNVGFMRNGKNLYIKIESFNTNTVKDIEAVVNDPNNKEVEGYIIDLRDNAGGLLYQAVGLVDLILDDGVIVSIDYKNPKSKEVFYAKKGNIFGKKKLIILVNKKSASASEIVASALQDHKRAMIMGSRTYGKTTVQQLYKLDDIGAVAITVAKYYRPSGATLIGGVTPDIITNVELKSSQVRNKHDKLLKLAFSKLENELG